MLKGKEMIKLSRYIACLSLLGLSQIGHADPVEPFALITIPKSGSHMIIKALHFLTGSSPVWHTSFPSVFYIPPEEGFLYTHLCVSPELEENYRSLPKLKKIVNIRDLRDVCVSIVHQICKSPWPGMSAEERRAFKKMSFDEQLLYVIEFDYDVQEVAGYAPNSLQTSIAKVAEQAVLYSQNPEYLVCKYENLVGTLGGGTEESQKEEIRRITSFIGLEIADSTVDEVSSYLYGNEVDPFGQGSLTNFRSTFHKGKIQKWKGVFQEEHKKVFKEKLGKYLIDLGYEQDDNW